MKLLEPVYEDYRWWAAKPDKATMMRQLAESEYHLYYGAPSVPMQERVRFILSLPSGRTFPYGLERTRPAIFWTLDDNYHWVNPLNQSFLWNGYRDVQGRVLGKGDSLTIQLLDGQEVVLWEYGKTYYDLDKFLPERNRQSILKMDTILQMVDGVHFTTERLAAFYRKRARLKNTFVFPNCIHLPDWNVLPFQRNVREDPEEVRVLWQGGGSHFADLLSIQEGLKWAVEKYPKVKFLFWGGHFPWVDRVLPDNRFVQLPWIPYSGYRPMLECLDFDFCLAPLVKSVFNEGKTSIKAYEPAALRHPKPTLAANVPPFSDDLIDGETVLLYSDIEEWKVKFAALVEDRELRKRIAERCQEWLEAERNAETWTRKLVAWFEESRGKGFSAAPELAALAGELVQRPSFKHELREARQLATEVT